MSKTTISEDNTTVLWEFEKGTDPGAVINKADGWAMYDEILMEFKAVKNINAAAILSLTVGNGLTIDGVALRIKLTYEQTTSFKNKIVYSDIKMRTGTEIDVPIPVIITINDTVSKIL